jgi:hypothetical protein
MLVWSSRVKISVWLATTLFTCTTFSTCIPGLTREAPAVRRLCVTYRWWYFCLKAFKDGLVCSFNAPEPSLIIRLTYYFYDHNIQEQQHKHGLHITCFVLNFLLIMCNLLHILIKNKNNNKRIQWAVIDINLLPIFMMGWANRPLNHFARAHYKRCNKWDHITHRRKQSIHFR